MTNEQIPSRGGATDEPTETQPGEAFPQSIEGPRGEKDSARRARDFYLEQRGLPVPEETDTADTAPDRDGDTEPTAENRATAGAKESNSMSEAQATTEPITGIVADAQAEFGVRAGSLGETFTDAESGIMIAPSAALDLAQAPEVAREALGVTGALSIDIASVRTSSQAGAQQVFLRSTDALTLVMDLVASSALVSSGRKFDANFQIIDFLTNAVKVNQWWRDIGFSWGTHFWISQGNNWGPNASDYTTPAKWGLNTGVYIYRATVEVQGIGPFSFSRDYAFRVR